MRVVGRSRLRHSTAHGYVTCSVLEASKAQFCRSSVFCGALLGLNSERLCVSDRVLPPDLSADVVCAGVSWRQCVHMSFTRICLWVYVVFTLRREHMRQWVHMLLHEMMLSRMDRDFVLRLLAHCSPVQILLLDLARIMHPCAIGALD